MADQSLRRCQHKQNAQVASHAQPYACTQMSKTWADIAETRIRRKGWSIGTPAGCWRPAAAAPLRQVAEQPPLGTER